MNSVLRVVGICHVSLLLLCLGCGPKAESIPERRPRPVSAELLRKQAPPGNSLVAASVGSWKTEQLGFEKVGGRIKYVLEPNAEITGRVFDKDGKLIIQGTKIAELESERYQLQVEQAEADLANAQQNLLQGRTQLNETIPAQISAAEASMALAKTEYERSQKLFSQRAGSRSDVDRDKANFENASSQLKQLLASKTSQEAQIISLENAVEQASQRLRDRQRDLEDCVLYSSFTGQIADVSVVPGSVVTAGQPIVTLQMMNPIKIELEVSAEISRSLQRTKRLPVQTVMPDGSLEFLEGGGFLYQIDPVADPLTRTFTLTLLAINEKLVTQSEQAVVATTDDIWRLDFDFLPASAKGRLFVEEEALLQDAEGYYLWQITNMTVQNKSNERELKVRKLRVSPGDLKVPFLGNWVFQQIDVDDEQFDPEVHLVIGRLRVNKGKPEDWQGDTVQLDTDGQWMLRPGDLVKVDLTGGGSEDGYFVPMDAICRSEGRTYIFAVTQADGGTVASRIPVRLVSQQMNNVTSSLRRIEPAEMSSLDGIQYITDGAHYLIDGEPVNVVGTNGTNAP